MADDMTTHTDKILSENHLDGLRTAYRQHAGTFRAWLVAFGVALPIFLSSNETIWGLFSKSPNARCIAYTFLCGISLQVILAIIDKYSDLFCLSAIMEWKDKDSVSTKCGVWWIKNDWPSIVADIVTLVLLGIAILGVIEVLLPR